MQRLLFVFRSSAEFCCCASQILMHRFWIFILFRYFSSGGKKKALSLKCLFLELDINLLTPTVSSVSHIFVCAARKLHRKSELVVSSVDRCTHQMKWEIYFLINVTGAAVHLAVLLFDIEKNNCAHHGWFTHSPSPAINVTCMCHPLVQTFFIYLSIAAGWRPYIVLVINTKSHYTRP